MECHPDVRPETQLRVGERVDVTSWGDGERIAVDGEDVFLPRSPKHVAADDNTGNQQHRHEDQPGVARGVHVHAARSAEHCQHGKPDERHEKHRVNGLPDFGPLDPAG
jgi:hypothetical protein